MIDRSRIYCVVMLPDEAKAISELCWGTCGKGIVGAIDIQIDNGGQDV
jgi:hypothetical protein